MFIARRIALVLGLILSAAVAGAQQAPLPEAAEAALTEARQTMQEALDTYQSQYPDRPLWQETFRHGRRARDLAPDHAAPLRFLAEAYSRSNWFGPAWNAWIDYLDRGYSLDADATPLFIEAGHEMAYNHYSAGRPEEALELYQRIIDEVPFDLEAHTWAGRILMELERPEAAISYWQTVVERNPDDARAEYFLELARDQAELGVDAVNSFREGVAFYEEGSMNRARERFARAAAQNEDYAEAWAWLGRVAFERGNYADARNYYGRATELAPDNETYSYFYEESGRRMQPEAGETDAEGAGEAEATGDETAAESEAGDSASDVSEADTSD